ncbi:MAG: HigA family addiction module antitoxin [Candidatus Marinimicrobia bacterium]|nr:HigA family addiction module antitoxin [Candidatus Neomarinimicrobiota bacterium]
MYNPLHPGEFIRELYITPNNLSSRKIALKLKVSPSTFTRLLNGESNLTPEMALRLSIVLGRSPESWLQMQDNHSLWMARQRVDLTGIKKMVFAPAQEKFSAYGNDNK